MSLQKKSSKQTLISKVPKANLEVYTCPKQPALNGCPKILGDARQHYAWPRDVQQDPKTSAVLQSVPS